MLDHKDLWVTDSQGKAGHLRRNKKFKSTCGFGPRWLPPSFHTNLKHYFPTHAYGFPLAMVPFESCLMNLLLKTSLNSWITRKKIKYKEQKQKLAWKKVSSSTLKASFCTFLQPTKSCEGFSQPRAGAATAHTNCLPADPKSMSPTWWPRRRKPPCPLCQVPPSHPI